MCLVIFVPSCDYTLKVPLQSFFYAIFLTCNPLFISQKIRCIVIHTICKTFHFFSQTFTNIFQVNKELSLSKYNNLLSIEAQNDEIIYNLNSISRLVFKKNSIYSQIHSNNKLKSTIRNDWFVAYFDFLTINAEMQ